MMGSKKKRAFLRWLSRGEKSDEELILYALDVMLPPLEDAGFEWVEIEHDGGKPLANSVTLERMNSPERIDSIEFLFDRGRQIKFAVSMRTRLKTPPHKWVRGGDLVANKRARGQQYWWKNHGFYFSRMRCFEHVVEKVRRALPQVLDYLNDGTVGPQIWDGEIHPSKKYIPDPDFD